jgi:hypothetical protein
MGMKYQRWMSAILGTLLASSCADFETPFSGGSFDPLSTAGYRQQRDESASGGNYQFSSGQYVTAASNSTAFFRKKPTGNADADELLSAGTTMRVIKSEGSFVKVELDSGKVGYVAAALLLESQQSMPAPLGADPAQPLPSGLQPGVAPTDLGEGAPLPPIAPPTSGELPPSSLDPKSAPEVPLPEPAKGDAIPKPPLGQ